MDHSYDVDDPKVALRQNIKHESSTCIVSNKKIVDNLGMRGRYTGSLSKKTKRPHGEGCMEYSFLTYEGQWIDGDWSGFGKLKNEHSSEIYEGGFFDNMKHGHGVLHYPDGKIYVGAFQFGRMKKGKMSYVDGSTFWGHYDSNSMPHGRGKFNFIDGSVFDGEFENGVIHGHGRMTWNDGRWYLGTWRNGEKNGRGIEVRSDGSICHEGHFCNDKVLCYRSFFHQRRSSEGCLLYPSSLTPGSPSTLVGPLPKKFSIVDSVLMDRIEHTNKETLN